MSQSLKTGMKTNKQKLQTEFTDKKSLKPPALTADETL